MPYSPGSDVGCSRIPDALGNFIARSFQSDKKGGAMPASLKTILLGDYTLAVSVLLSFEESSVSSSSSALAAVDAVELDE